MNRAALALLMFLPLVLVVACTANGNSSNQTNSFGYPDLAKNLERDVKSERDKAKRLEEELEDHKKRAGEIDAQINKLINEHKALRDKIDKGQGPYKDMSDTAKLAAWAEQTSRILELESISVLVMGLK